MSLFLQEKYIKWHFSHLPRFKKKNDGLYNVRCPLCGDSEKNKRLARGYFYVKGNQWRYKCHNCGAAPSFERFLKQQNASAYSEYLKEKIQMNAPLEPEEATPVPVKERYPEEYLALPTLAQLPPFHPAVEYLRGRKIDEKWFKILRWTEDFHGLCHTLRPERYEEAKFKDPRIIIPFEDQFGLQGFQGRSLDPDSIRYISVKLEDRPKTFGLLNVDRSRKHYIVEGPFDAMCLENTLATCDSNLASQANSNSILVFDNEPRNRDILNLMTKAIKANHKVVIWPSGIEQKDINDMALGEIDYRKIIEENVYSGLAARARLAEWRKI